ncbi:hypothetical protein [Ectobacillus panaciterrae]|nr:hypothetical protein [Ectobacillus panaciterrae]
MAAPSRWSWTPRKAEPAAPDIKKKANIALAYMGNTRQDRRNNRG